MARDVPVASIKVKDAPATPSPPWLTTRPEIDTFAAVGANVVPTDQFEKAVTPLITNVWVGTSKLVGANPNVPEPF